MTQLPTSPTSDDALGDVFEALRREVSLIRNAVEGLTAARERIPDYSATLGRMAEALKANAAGIGRIEASPAVQLSPTALSEEIIKASAAIRTEDAARLDAARDAMVRSIGRIDGVVERGQAADRQTKRLIWTATAGMLAGVLLWSALPGALARSLPERWHVPEWMAARTMGVDEATAGQRLIVVAAGQAGQKDR